MAGFSSSIKKGIAFKIFGNNLLIAATLLLPSLNLGV